METLSVCEERLKKQIFLKKEILEKGYDAQEFQEFLEKKKMELITISKELLLVEKDPFFRQILEITLMKWGEIIIQEPFETKKSKGYSFIGAPLAPYAIFESLTFKNPFLIFYKSKIHQLAFKLEHTLLSSNIATK